MSVPSLVMNEKTITNQKEIANLFNNYFLSVTDSINVDNNKAKNSSMFNPINYLFKYYGKPFATLNWHCTSTYEIGKIIKSLKSKNTSGYDEISNCIIKLSSFVISPLMYICNAELSSGAFPDRLKYAIVKPILKKKKAVNRTSQTIDQYLY